jgi:5-methylcytosine-specific restriction protein A
MPSKSLRFCLHSGCKNLTRNGYCPEHADEAEQKRKDQFKRYDQRRGSASERGYDSRWAKASKWFLKQPGNQICKLHLPGCKIVAECVDHIEPPDGPDDPKFWDPDNWQPACIRCNSVKGNKKMKGNYEL